MRKIKIFWSYARSDVQEAAHIRTSWLNELQAAIESKLSVDNVRSPYQILRDCHGMIVGGDVIAEKVTQAIRDCDLALLFVSEAYILSPECAKEVRQLRELNKTVIVVEMLKDWHIHESSLLGEEGRALRDEQLAVVFWEMDGAAPRPLADPAPSCVPREKQQPFHDRVHELDTAIRVQSARLREGTPEVTTPAPEVTTPAPEVGTPAAAPRSNGAGRHDLYLASATKDSAALTARLQQAIEARGFTVLHLDLADENVTAGWTEDTLRAHVASCACYAQVVGPSPGVDFPGSGKKIVQAQYDAALEAGHQPQVLLHPNIDPRECDGAYREFLDGCGYQDVTLEAFETYLIKQLERAREKARADEERAEILSRRDSILQVAIDFDPADRDKYDLLSDMLKEHRIAIGRAIIDNPKKKEMKEVADLSDGVVVVYGKSAGAQKRANAHFQMFLRYSRKGRKEICKLALGNAAPDDAILPWAPDVPEIGLRGGVDQEAFGLFLGNLGARADDAAAEV